MMDSQLRDKWDTRYRVAGKPSKPPKVLAENAHLLPNAGHALDLACGLGAGALLLARHGLTVDAWDISAIAIDQLAKTAHDQQLQIDAAVRNVELSPPEEASYDVILVSHFLVREMAATLMAALKPGGLLFYQTYTRAVSKHGPSNPAYRLADNELLNLFSPLKLHFYREEGWLGDIKQGCRDIAMLIGEK
ncbi:MAG: class I SAM-dependent methyltransferase [Candidatus Polarisedimenticolaceae bacterium]|nr:class I SAM-dependent methyltransferase [Candidatus Polarisedimenticolaceae bacterium]